MYVVVGGRCGVGTSKDAATARPVVANHHGGGGISVTVTTLLSTTVTENVDFMKPVC